MIEHIDVGGKHRCRVWCKHCGTLVLLPERTWFGYSYKQRCTDCRLARAQAQMLIGSVGALVCLVAVLLIQLTA